MDRSERESLALKLLAAEREKDRGESGFPPTYGPGEEEARVFDPAMKHHVSAYRKGEPVFECESDRTEWRRLNRHALQHALGLVGTHPWLRDRLVLRGSAALASWYGARAREPHDIDWVVRDPELRIDSADGQRIIHTIEQVLRAAHETGELSLWPDRIESDLIWTYSRVPGRRVSIPWKREGVPAGVVQLDVVFDERLHRAPQLENVCVSDGARPARLWLASREESLAWKILWLVSDVYPQGKDLFDAALLAQDVRLADTLLQQVMRAADVAQDNAEALGEGWRAVLSDARYLDWDNFLAEYPELDRPRDALVTAVLASVERG